MTLTRRQLLKTTALAGAGTALLGPQALMTRRAQAATTFTGVTYLPPSYKALTYGSAGFVDYLGNNGGDVLEVDFYDSGQLLKADEQLPALRSRTIDFMFHTTSYITRSLPILGITGLPGVVGELYRHPERLRLGSPLFELINEQLAKENLYMLSSGGGILEPEYIWSTQQHAVRQLDDIRGKKVRVVSFEATSALEAYDIGAVRIPSSETYMALQRGTVDAGVFNISTIIGRSLQEQVDVCYQLPITGFSVAPFMLRDRWDALDNDSRSLLTDAARWYDDNFIHHCNDDIYPNDYWPQVRAENVEVIAPTEEDLAAFNETTHKVWDHWKGEVGEDIGERAIQLALGQS
ncbi:substrate-binding domain-containing protein [Halomonas denitrificans]|uniref:TRAP transporter substrate-binding protein n=1 Tax=Halomonas denitrificans TaxID=370769 RepID=UPI001CD5867A|nr:substrate-binding domain-containing protein [Halomonas denitrificans]MCA0976093.1 substrate-binding domain-containing protein [Halomonas denitrificans]